MKLDGFSGKMTEGTLRGLFLAGEHVLGVSNSQVPHEDGDLERSGTSTVDEGKKRVGVSYDTKYAVRQHEDMSYRHDAGRNAKFLENAFNSEADQIRKILVVQIQKSTGLS